VAAGSSRHLGPGLFITFEGGEGTGKSTQTTKLAARIREAGREVYSAREPGGTDLGDMLRPITRKPAWARRFFSEITSEEHWSGLTPLAELFLYEAARAQLTHELIERRLIEGATVILDRYTDSTLAYQGYGRGIPPEVIRTINDIATRGSSPNLTILLDLEVERGLARKLGEIGQDAIGHEHRDFHQRVRDGYLEMARAEPDRWVVLDAELPPEELSERIWEIVKPRLR
jgi:dTMP kinase